uniref:Uncharacterized protein n=1 Tax=Glossina palpalis gambiensis TaxID=67801 RepID=A0A1B0AZR0_9MUSC
MSMHGCRLFAIAQYFLDTLIYMHYLYCMKRILEHYTHNKDVNMPSFSASEYKKIEGEVIKRQKH